MLWSHQRPCESEPAMARRARDLVRPSPSRQLLPHVQGVCGWLSLCVASDYQALCVHHVRSAG
jgi:hypothetical protein